MLFFKRCNHAKGGQDSWLKDPKEKTESNIKQWVCLEMKKFLNIKMCKCSSVFFNDP